MPKREIPEPWAASPAAGSEPYARKNVYFVGDGMEEVYDYCVWRATVRGHCKLDGTVARGTSEMIVDILRREYLKSMLEQDATDFRDWRRERYTRAGLDPEAASQPTRWPEGFPARTFTRTPLAAARTTTTVFDTRMFQEADLPEPSAALVGVRLRGRSKRDDERRIAAWIQQRGKCGVCGERRLLEPKTTPSAPANRDNSIRNDCVLVLVCASCKSSSGEDANQTSRTG